MRRLKGAQKDDYILHLTSVDPWFTVAQKERLDFQLDLGKVEVQSRLQIAGRKEIL